MTPSRRAAAALTVSALVYIALQVFGPIVGGEGAAHVYTEMILRQLLTWGLPALMMARGYFSRTLWRVYPADCVLAAAAGAAAQFLLSAVTEAVQRALGAQPAMLPMPSGALEWVLGVLALVIVPAVTEEIFFRGGVMRALMAEGWRMAAAAVTAAIFAGLHASLSGLAAYLCVGMLLSLSMLSSRSLVPCILMHGAYNAFALIWALCPAGRGVLAVSAAVIALAAFILRAWRRRAPRCGGSPRPLWMVAAAGVLVMLVRIL